MVTIFLVYNAQWQEGVTRTCFKCLGNIILRMKHVLPTDILFTYFFSLFKKWPVLVVLIKSYLIILQFWATQNKFLVSYPFNSEKWSARADSNFIFYFFCTENHGWRWHDLPSHHSSHDLPSHLNSQLARNMGVSLTLLKLIIDRSYYHRVKI